MRAGYARFEGSIVEQQIYTLNAPAVGAIGVAPITGFAWWYVVAAFFNVDNSGGLATATPNLTANQGSTGVWSASGLGLGIGGANSIVQMGIGINLGTDNIGRQYIPLPMCPVVGQGSVTWGWSDGDANTLAGNLTLVIVGERYENKRES